jgi:hypothetical protein
MEFTIAIWSFFFLARAGQSGTILLPVTISVLPRWFPNGIGRSLNPSANMALCYGWRTAILFDTSLPRLHKVLFNDAADSCRFVFVFINPLSTC